MAATMYKVANGDAKVNASETALAGAETITASVAAGEVAIIVDSTVPLNTNIVTATIDRLRDLLMESNK